MKMPNLCPFEKKEKEVLDNFFFQEQKRKFQGTKVVTWTKKICS
jgi:hypothetical protein